MEHSCLKCFRMAPGGWGKSLGKYCAGPYLALFSHTREIKSGGPARRPGRMAPRRAAPWRPTQRLSEALNAHIGDTFLFVGTFVGTYNIFHQFFIVQIDSGPAPIPHPSLHYPSLFIPNQPERQTRPVHVYSWHTHRAARIAIKITLSARGGAICPLSRPDNMRKCYFNKCRHNFRTEM